MYDKEKHGEIKEHRVELLDEYDVTENGFCVNIKPRKINDVYKDVIAEFKKRGAWGEYGHWSLDYFSSMHKDYDPDRLIYWPENAKWTSIFHVRGGSEGYYIHVEVITGDGKRHLIFLGKTLGNRESAREVQRMLEDIFDV